MSEKKMQHVFATVVFVGERSHIEQSLQSMSKTVTRRVKEDGALFEPIRVKEAYDEGWSYELYRTPCKSANKNDIDQALKRLTPALKYRITSWQTLDYFA